MPGAPDPAYVQARRVLLDALEALEPHLDAVILVGAQAVYLHTGEADLAVAPYTTDADLALDVESLGAEPRLETAMQAAGFVRDQVGGWRGAGDVSIDLMVATTQGGGGRRAARIPPHDRRAVRKALGLEGALVDRSRQRVAALDPADERGFDVFVAGPAALVVAKLVKIHERRDDVGRSNDKDALDVLRLLRVASARGLAERLRQIEADERARAVARMARSLLPELFGAAGAPGCEMAVRATTGLEDPAQIASSLVALTAELMSELERARRD